MGIARSTFYDEPSASNDDTAIVEAIAAICDEFEAYGWRRVRAELRHRDRSSNHKKIRRLMLVRLKGPTPDRRPKVTPPLLCADSSARHDRDFRKVAHFGAQPMVHVCPIVPAARHQRHQEETLPRKHLCDLGADLDRHLGLRPVQCGPALGRLTPTPFWGRSGKAGILLQAPSTPTVVC
jgi:HTH-like domain